MFFQEARTRDSSSTFLLLKSQVKLGWSVITDAVGLSPSPDSILLSEQDPSFVAPLLSSRAPEFSDLVFGSFSSFLITTATE